MTALLHAQTLALVTDLELIPGWDELTERVRAAVRGGVDLVQVRAKTLSTQEQKELASLLVSVVGVHARVVVNGDPEVAKTSGADGVHLPESGAGSSISRARALLGPDALIGKSVHSVQAAVAAASEGADYIIFGTVFPTRSHAGGPASGTAGVAGAANAVSVPVIGIGGITAQNCKSVIDAGAAGVAVIGAIIGEYDSYRATRALHSAMTGGKSHARDAHASGVHVGFTYAGGAAR
ncbi:MAG: thiamine phosphate synthase [Chloroflexi bacterium]|nr:thiamine phosphate synthase [Chloroflexota bacterium]